MTSSTTGDARQCNCKIGRNIETYDLPELDAEIVRERENNDSSLRKLAAFVNTRILDTALENADADVVGDAESVYNALTADDVSPQRRAAIRNQLRDVGIDVDDLTSDFVSYQAVRRHLQDCRGMETGRSGITTIKEGRQSIAKTRERERQIIERTLERLQRIDALESTDIDVSISARVRCEACRTSHTIDEYLDHAGCDCSG